MIKAGLIVVLAGVTSLYFPESRRVLLDVAEPVLRPVIRWGAEEEMARVGQNVVDRERLVGTLPSGPAWPGWLNERYSTDEPRTDPWGSLYQLSVWQDSIGIVSHGPDRIKDTEDDFLVVTRRE